MARVAATSVEGNFSKGLITEASGLNFPEHAATETFDVDFKQKGNATRRRGFDPEDGYVFQDVGEDISGINEYVWKNVSNLGTLTFVVQQVGPTLYYFETSGDALSPGLKDDVTDLTDFLVPGGTMGDGSVCQFATGDGKLFVAHPGLQPFYVSYDAASDSITATQIDLKIRDFRRQADGYATDFRPATLTNLHKYNLYNQGWYFSAATDTGSDPGDDPATIQVLQYWDSHSSVFPSNADVWWLFRNAEDEMDHKEFDKVYRGNSPAINGHYILNPFATDRSGASGITGVAEDSSAGARPQSVAFYAGRVFWGGTQAAGYGDKVYYSQIIESPEQIGNCYSANDPTSSENSDLLPSDGGVIVVQGMGILIKLMPMGNSLVAFASNGVWMISGSTGAGFAANDYSVSRIGDATAGAVGSMSMVEAEGNIFYWNRNGIYVAATGQQGEIGCDSVTNLTIKSFYNDIPIDSIPYVKGAYDPVEKLIQWIYRNTAAEDVAENFKYDRILNLRITTQAFYPWTISTTQELAGAPSISGILCIAGASGVSRVLEIVTVEGEEVILG